MSFAGTRRAERMVRRGSGPMWVRSVRRHFKGRSKLVRINVYSQELTKEVTLVEKKADTGITHYGVRFWLASPDVLHHTPEDDDRSAITFWLPENRTFSPDDLIALFNDAQSLADHAKWMIEQREREAGMESPAQVTATAGQGTDGRVRSMAMAAAEELENGNVSCAALWLGRMLETYVR